MWLPEEGSAARVLLQMEGGPERAEVTPRQAQALVLGLHELATNAAKYGALSWPDGRIALRCELSVEGAATIYWVERGGPRIDGPPARRGFGTRLLERAITQDLGPGSLVELLFEPEGLRAVIRLPLATEADCKPRWRHTEHHGD
jgi:two-component sensor histidine kinase